MRRWLQSPRSHAIWMVLPALLVTSNSTASSKPEKPQKRLPALLAQVEAHYAKSGSFSASFTQEEHSAAFGEKKSSHGTLAWKAPNLLRWETQSPDASLLVSNGTTLWVYTPPFDESENGQVIIRKASEVKNRLIDALLAGRFSAALKKDLQITPLRNRDFLLKPSKSSGTGLKQVTVTISENQPLISKVLIEYLDGNRSAIELSKIKMGDALPKTTFEFKIPPRTDVIKE